MKKRIILIITSVVAILVVAGLIVFTVVSKTKKTDKDAIVPPTSDNQDVNLEEPDYDFGLDSDEDVEYKKNNKDLSYLIGDEITDSIFVQNYEEIKDNFPFIKAENGKFIAEKAGEATATIISENKQITLHVYVYEDGNGTEENPYVIVRIKDLVRHFNECNQGVYYIQKADLDLSTYNGGNWIPLGKNSYPFMSNYDGNNYKIYNMNITIDESNLEDYVDKQNVNGTEVNSLMVGFFGVVCGQNEDKKIEIKDMTISYAKVDSSALDTGSVKGSNKLFQSIDYISISLFAGNVTYAKIENVAVNGEINSSMNAKSYQSEFISQVAGAIGTIDYSSVNGLYGMVTIDATGVGNVNGAEVYGSCVAGLIGKVYDGCELEKCASCPTIYAKNYAKTYISGMFGVIGESERNSISNSVVTKGNIGVNAGGKYNAMIAGFAIKLCNENTITNSRVLNTYINNETKFLGTSNSAGFVYTNEGEIKDSYISGGAIEGVEVAGFVFDNNSNISYTEEFEKNYVLNITVNGELGMAGFVYSNRGSIEAQNQEDVYARLNWVKINKEFYTFYKGFDSMMSAGFVENAEQGSKISNFNITTNMYDVVNCAGAVGFVNGKTTIQNLIVSTTVRTLTEEDGKNYSGATGLVSGLIGNIPANVQDEITIENVQVNISVNKIKEEGKEYSLGIYGSLFGINYAKNVTLKNVKIQSVYVNADIALGLKDVSEIKIGSIAGLAMSYDQFTVENVKSIQGEVILDGNSTTIDRYKYFN